MSIERIKTDIETDFMARFPALQPTVNITGENADFDPPTNEPWVRMSMIAPLISYPCINDAQEQIDGFFSVQVFTPSKQGGNQAYAIADDVKQILKSSVLNAISFLDFESTSGSYEAGWFMIVMRGRFRAFN